MHQAALLGSRLASATEDAPPLAAGVEALICGRRPLPRFADLVEAVGTPAEHNAKPPHASRLPIRIISAASSCSLHEKSLWKAYSSRGLHELLNIELIDVLALRIRRVIAPAVLSNLRSRSDLNGQHAVVIGPQDSDTRRVPARVLRTGECIRIKPVNLFGEDSLPVVLECGAGSGSLANALGEKLRGYALVIAADSHHDHLDKTAADAEMVESVLQLDSEAAIARFQPTYVIVAWMPSGIDWTLHARACAACREYLLLGEADGSTCGDGWATWGIVPDNGWEYGLDEDSIAPPAADGFARTDLSPASRLQVCRFDSAVARGFSNTVCFTRKGCEPAKDGEDDDEDEPLEASWERMQRSLQAGRAQRLDVQMEVDVTK